MRGRNAPRLRRFVKGECRYCGGVVPKPRRSWCSAECVEEFQIRAWPQHARLRVEERDHGICATCGCDTDKIQRIAHWVIRDADEGVGTWQDVLQAREGAHQFLRDLGFSALRSLWDVDHILPVDLGGGSCGLMNLQTLCRPCHKTKTAQQAAMKAAAKALKRRIDAAR